jgi:hypothetical protein
MVSGLPSSASWQDLKVGMCMQDFEIDVSLNLKYTIHFSGSYAASW